MLYISTSELNLHHHILAYLLSLFPLKIELSLPRLTASHSGAPLSLTTQEAEAQEEDGWCYHQNPVFLHPKKEGLLFHYCITIYSKGIFNFFFFFNTVSTDMVMYTPLILRLWRQIFESSRMAWVT